MSRTLSNVPLRVHSTGLYWQGVIDLFNASNPSGNFTDNSVYRTLLSLALVVGFLVACKRFWLGLMLGKQTFGKCNLCFLIEGVTEKFTRLSVFSSLWRGASGGYEEVFAHRAGCRLGP